MGIALSATLVSGCIAAPINEKIADNYGNAGSEAIARGDWDTARRAFARSAMNTELARSDPGRQAIFRYEYGRALGVTCFFEEAEKELKLAYDLDKKAGQPLYLSLFELARLNFDQRKYPEAVSYFEQALPEADKVDASKQSPIDYADILDEYALALAGTGRSEDAKNASRRAGELRTAFRVC